MKNTGVKLDPSIHHTSLHDLYMKNVQQAQKCHHYETFTEYNDFWIQLIIWRINSNWEIRILKDLLGQKIFPLDGTSSDTVMYQYVLAPYD